MNEVAQLAGQDPPRHPIVPAGDGASGAISRRTALKLVGLLGLAACDSSAGGLLTPEKSSAPASSPVDLSKGLAAYRPTQGLILIATATGVDAHGTALTPDGYRIDLGEEIVHSFTGRGVFTPSIVHPEWILPALPPAVPQLPPELAEAGTACDLVTLFPSVDSYLGLVEEIERQLADRAEDCHNRALVLHDEVAELIRQVGSECDPYGYDDSPTPVLIPAAQGGFGELLCGGYDRYITALNYISPVLESIATRVSMCEAVAAGLAGLRAQLLSGEPVCASLIPSLRTVRWNAQQLPAEFELVRRLRELLVADDIAQWCQRCGGSLPAGTYLSGAVLRELERQVLGRYVGAFESQAAREEGPVAERFRKVARRLAEAPADRVLRVVFPSGSAVGQDVIVLSAAPDDGSSPLVMVFTALSKGAPLPAPNPADLGLLLSEIRRARQLLSYGEQGSEFVSS